MEEQLNLDVTVIADRSAYEVGLYGVLAGKLPIRFRLGL